MSKFEVVRGVEGCCLALDDTRIAGPKPWGGGTVIHAWETNEKYGVVDTQDHCHQLKAENEQLRKLCERFAEYVSFDRCEGCVCKSSCREGLVDACWQLTEIREQASELGIEVDE